MRATLLLILALPLVACQTKRKFVLPSGASYEDNGHLAGDTLVMMKPDGTTILRNKMNEPWAKTNDTILGGIMGVQAGMTQRAFNAGEVAVDIGAQKAVTAGKLIDSKTTLGLGEQAVQTTRILNPPKP